MTKQQKKPLNIRGTLADFNGLIFADDKTVSFKPWDGEREEENAKVIESNKKKLEGGRFCKYASLILQNMCVSIAGYEFWKPDERNPGSYVEIIKKPERELVISQMWEADVLAAYFMLRNDALCDSSAEFEVLSPFDLDKERVCLWKGDLSEIEIVGAPTIEEALWEYQLKKPFIFRGGEITKLVLGPMKWFSSEQVTLEKPGALNLKTIAASIHKVPEHFDGNIQVNVHDLKRMSKADIRAIEKQYDSHHSGLDMSIRVFDDVKEKWFDASIPWMSTDFFDATSQ